MGANISHDRPLSASEALGTDKIWLEGLCRNRRGVTRQVSAQSGFVKLSFEAGMGRQNLHLWL